MLEQAIFWDFDGTLVYSHKLWTTAVFEVMQELFALLAKIQDPELSMQRARADQPERGMANEAQSGKRERRLVPPAETGRLRNLKAVCHGRVAGARFSAGGDPGPGLSAQPAAEGFGSG